MHSEFDDLKGRRCDRFSVDEAMRIVMGLQKQEYPHQQELCLYCLVLWIRFPELHSTIDAYFAQAVIRLASKRWLGADEPEDEPDAYEMLKLNLELQGLKAHLRGIPDLSIATEAWPVRLLDAKVANPSRDFEQRMVLARYLITAILHKPLLLVRKYAQAAFAADIMAMGDKFWGKRKGKSVGPAKASFDVLWDGAGKTLLLQHLLWQNAPKGRTDEWSDGAPIDVKMLQHGSPFAKRLKSGGLFSSFFNEQLPPEQVIDAKRLFLRYRWLIKRMNASKPEFKVVSKKWAPLNRDDVWPSTLDSKNIKDYFEHYEFNKKQKQIATDAISGKARFSRGANL